MKKLISGIYEIELISQQGGTAAVSVFLVPGSSGSRSLMIDAGFAGSAGRKQVKAALQQLGIDGKMLDVLITHRHHDHCGLAQYLIHQGAVIYMSPLEQQHEYDCLSCRYDDRAMQEQWMVLNTVGITAVREPEIWKKYMEINRRVENNQRWLFDVPDFPYRPVTAGQKFLYGDYRFTALPLKGHTLGQMGLYDADRKLLFCADQVINGIVPIVGTTHKDEHLLKCYFESLEQIKHNFAKYLVVPSHNGPIRQLPETIDRIALSYLKKLDTVKRILVCQQVPMTVKEIACRAYGIDQMPATDDQFIKLKMVISKTFSCLEYLFDQGLIERSEQDGVLYWKV